MALFAIFEWAEDKSLSILPVTCITSGNKSKGESVKARFQRKVYDAVVLDIGKFCVLLMCALAI